MHLIPLRSIQTVERYSIKYHCIKESIFLNQKGREFWHLRHILYLSNVLYKEFSVMGMFFLSYLLCDFLHFPLSTWYLSRAIQNFEDKIVYWIFVKKHEHWNWPLVSAKANFTLHFHGKWYDAMWLAWPLSQWYWLDKFFIIQYW